MDEPSNPETITAPQKAPPSKRADMEIKVSADKEQGSVCMELEVTGDGAQPVKVQVFLTLDEVKQLALTLVKAGNHVAMHQGGGPRIVLPTNDGRPQVIDLPPE